MKGKGEQQTYWLVGENDEMRKLRSAERQRRRAALAGKSITNGIDSNGHCIIPRSSLKSKNSIPRSPIPRCSSFESPKRLRFANHEQKLGDFLEVIIDSPCKKSANSLIETKIDCNGESLKTSSTSCPCIENLANSTATLAYSQLFMFFEGGKKQQFIKPSCSSVPVLYPHLNLPINKTTSAPCSPKKNEIIRMSHLPEGEEEIPWIDSTPLLSRNECVYH